MDDFLALAEGRERACLESAERDERGYFRARHRAFGEHRRYTPHAPAAAVAASADSPTGPAAAAASSAHYLGDSTAGMSPRVASGIVRAHFTKSLYRLAPPVGDAAASRPIDTADIDAVLRQLRKRHLELAAQRDGNGNGGGITAVHYRSDRAAAARRRLSQLQREEAEQRNDVELIEIHRADLFDVLLRVQPYSAMLELQRGEADARQRLRVGWAEATELLLLRLHDATDAFDEQLLANVASPQRRQRVLSASPRRGDAAAAGSPSPPPSPSPRRAQSGSRRSQSGPPVAVDDEWVAGFVGALERAGRLDIARARDTFVDLLDADAFTAADLVRRGVLVCRGRRGGGFRVTESPASAVAAGATLPLYFEGCLRHAAADEALQRELLEELELRECIRRDMLVRSSARRRSSGSAAASPV